MLCILESFWARWTGLLRVALNSSNDALERRSSTLRCVIMAECSVTGGTLWRAPVENMYPECMASVEKRRHDFRFIDELKWHVLPWLLSLWLDDTMKGLSVTRSVKKHKNVSLVLSGCSRRIHNKHETQQWNGKNTRWWDASWSSFNLSDTCLERRSCKHVTLETIEKQKLLLYVW